MTEAEAAKELETLAQRSRGITGFIIRRTRRRFQRRGL
jgi:hypothetical protein